MGGKARRDRWVRVGYGFWSRFEWFENVGKPFVNGRCRGIVINGLVGGVLVFD